MKKGGGEFKLGRDIHLEQGKYDEVSSPYLISSGGLGPCIAIGIYHKSKGKGYMLHVANPSRDYGSVDVFLNYVITHTKNSLGLKVYIHGSSIDRIDGDEGNEDANEDRAYVERIVREKLKTQNITIDWCQKDSTCELFLYTETGEFKTENNLRDEILDESE